MIEAFVKRWDKNNSNLLRSFEEILPSDYKDIVERLVEVVLEDEESSPDHKRIQQIDHGHYQGTLVYIIAENGYQPSNYWSVKISYGSCSGCDTFERIIGGNDKKAMAKDFWNLSLHILQNIKEI